MAQNEVLQAMETRASVKRFESTPVSESDLQSIIQAGLRAPSGLNKQSPIILAVTEPATVKKLSELNAGKDPFFRADPFYGAPAVLVVLADKSVPTYVYDGSLVMGQMLLAAQSLGLGACWIHRAKETFEMPEGKALLKKLGIEGEYEGIGNCIIGYADIEPEKKPRKEHRVFWIE